MDSAGDSVCWSNVNMTGNTQASLLYSNGEVWADSVNITFNGTTIGNIALPWCTTGGAWNGVCATASTTFPAQSGTGSLCLVGVGPNWIGALNRLSVGGP
jgi:hypothetical protein